MLTLSRGLGASGGGVAVTAGAYAVPGGRIGAAEQVSGGAPGRTRTCGQVLRSHPAPSAVQTSLNTGRH
jgi:hypothetical protein